MGDRRMLSNEHAVVGEDVVVTKLDCPVSNKFGQISKVSANGDRLRISVSFDGEIYNFSLEDLSLA